MAKVASGHKPCPRTPRARLSEAEVIRKRIAKAERRIAAGKNKLYEGAVRFRLINRLEEMKEML